MRGGEVVEEFFPGSTPMQDEESAGFQARTEVASSPSQLSGRLEAKLNRKTAG